jgi:hypothetical protein
VLRLAVAGATDAKLGRAEAKLRAVEERAKTLRAELAEFDEQIASTERALADAKAQRDRDMVADQIEEMAAAIEQAAPGFGAGAAALVDAVTKKSDVSAGGDQVLDQRGCGASGGSRSCGLDLLGAPIRRGAHARGQCEYRHRCDSRAGATANAGGRSAINLHPQCAALAGRR